MNDIASAHPGRNGGGSESPHVVLICIDALRADCLEAPSAGSIWSALGRPVTPALDAFAARSLAHANATASSSWTKPAVPSVLLSRHPSEHGVLEVAKNVRRGGLSAALPDDAETLAERLRGAGYRTIGLAHNAQLDPALGFARGFDAFACDAGDGESILATARELAPFEDGRPVFFYLHFLEPHWPYRPPIVKRAKAHATGRFPFHTYRGSDWRALKRELKVRRLELTEDEVDFLRIVYRLAVEEADRVVGLTLEWLATQGALEHAVTLVLADHGEELLDHGLVGHGQSVHAELLRVPFLLSAGRATGMAVPAGDISSELVSHVDVLPTLTGAAGVGVPGTVSGRDILRQEEPEFVFSEVKHKRRYHQAVRDRRWKLVRSRYFRRAENGNGGSEDYNNLPELFAGRPFRLEHRLYDLRADPRELTDLSGSRAGEVARLGAALDHWWEGRTTHGGNVREIEEDMIRRLEALGYL